MGIKQDYNPKPSGNVKTVPFDSVEEAWFWFIQAQAAKNEGARSVAGLGAVPRPCEPIDILKIVERLYRQRRLLWEHLLVLRHYGRRLLAPDLSRAKEARASLLWAQAIEKLQPVLEKKGIITPSQWPFFNDMEAAE